MENIEVVPSAEEFFLKKSNELQSDPEDMPDWMIEAAKELAKMHVKAALCAAAFSDDLEHSPSNQRIILHSYPEENIK